MVSPRYVPCLMFFEWLVVLNMGKTADLTNKHEGINPWRWELIGFELEHIYHGL